MIKQRRFVSKQGYRQPNIHSKARVLSPQLLNWSIARCNEVALGAKLVCFAPFLSFIPKPAS